MPQDSAPSTQPPEELREPSTTRSEKEEATDRADKFIAVNEKILRLREKLRPKSAQEKASTASNSASEISHDATTNT
jgi:hypothetical protein